MADSPISAVLSAMEALDVEGCIALFTPDGRLLTTDGEVAEGLNAVRAVLSNLFADLQAATYRVTAQWHPEDDVWIAEVDATYDLKEHGLRGPYPRAVVLRGGREIGELRVYGRHELPLTESSVPYREVLAGNRWLATL
jgi:uncharacterized protein (TIGR02246 family)